MGRQEITSGTTKEFLQKINDNFIELYESSVNITSGTKAPNDSEGQDGDIYIQYEE